MHKIWSNYVTTSESEARVIPMIEGDECEVEGFIFSSGGYKVSKQPKANENIQVLENVLRK